MNRHYGRTNRRSNWPETPTVAELVLADERLKAGFSKVMLPTLILHGRSGQIEVPRE
jgi:hypothetical protein